MGFQDDLCGILGERHTSKTKEEEMNSICEHFLVNRCSRCIETLDAGVGFECCAQTQAGRPQGCKLGQSFEVIRPASSMHDAIAPIYGRTYKLNFPIVDKSTTL